MERQPVSPAPRLHYGYVVIVLVMLAVFGSLGVGRFGYTIILPAMQDALKLTNTQAGELQSWNLLAYSLTAALMGVLAARFGPRLVIPFALLLASFAITATGLFPTFDSARVARFFAGVAGAGANIPAMGMIPSWFGIRRRGIASGVGVAGSSLGLIVSGPLVPFILNQYGADGWRVSWYALGALSFVTFILCALFLRNRPEEMNLRPVGETENERVRRIAQANVPTFDWSRVYKSRLLWELTAIYFAFGFAYIIYSTFFIRYLARELSWSAGDAGGLWFQVGVGTIISGLLWGSVSDRWGRRVALICVFTLQGISFLLFGLTHALPGIYVSAILFAITAWSVPTLMAAIVGDVYGARLAPAALGLMTIIFGAGQALGPYIAGIIADTTQSFSLAFILAGSISLLGAFGAIFVRLRKEEERI